MKKLSGYYDELHTKVALFKNQSQKPIVISESIVNKSLINSNGIEVANSFTTEVERVLTERFSLLNPIIVITIEGKAKGENEGICSLGTYTIQTTTEIKHRLDLHSLVARTVDFAQQLHKHKANIKIE